MHSSSQPPSVPKPLHPSTRRPTLVGLLALLSTAAAPPAPGPSPAVPGTPTPTSSPPSTVTQGARCQPDRPLGGILRPSPTKQIVKAKVHIGFEHGCSQSEETIGVIAEVALELSGDQVRLSIESFENKGFGPSPGRYFQGDRSFHHDSVRWHWAYTGVATRAEGGLGLRFDQVETSVDRSGGIKYAETKRTAANKSVRCVEAPVGVLPAYSSGPRQPADDVPGCASVVLCTGLFELVPIPFTSLVSIAPRALVDGALPLLPGAGIDIDAQQFHSSNWTYFRRSAP